MILYTGVIPSKSIPENNDIIYQVLSVKVYPKTMIYILDVISESIPENNDIIYLGVISKSIPENNDIIYLVLSVKVYPKTMILYTWCYQ